MRIGFVYTVPYASFCCTYRQLGHLDDEDSMLYAPHRTPFECPQTPAQMLHSRLADPARQIMFLFFFKLNARWSFSHLL